MKIVVMWLLLLAIAPFSVHAASKSFTPQTAFSGASEGNGSLTLLFGKKRPFHVVSLGRTLGDGRFRLDQTVQFEGKPPTHRHWLLTTVAPLVYTGTLSDAAGRVTGHAAGARLVLRYRLKGPLVMHQTLDLLPDGSINNVGRITLLGLPVGHLQETISRRTGH